MADSLSWSVHSHEHKDRPVDWFWTLGFIAVVAALVSVYFGNILFAIIIAISAVSLGILIARGPRLHAVKLDSRGVVVDGTIHPYANIDSFWVEEKKEFPRLLVSTKGILHPQLIIPLEDPSRASEVRQYLRRFVREQEQEPHFGEHLIEMFGL